MVFLKRFHEALFPARDSARCRDALIFFHTAVCCFSRILLSKFNIWKLSAHAGLFWCLHNPPARSLTCVCDFAVVPNSRYGLFCLFVANMAFFLSFFACMHVHICTRGTSVSSSSSMLL